MDRWIRANDRWKHDGRFV